MPHMLSPQVLNPPQLAPHLATSPTHARSLEDYQTAPMLPHIGEEYQFRITNKLLIQKITNPRRDKTIMDSLMHAAPKFLSKKKHSALSNHRSLLYRRKHQQKTQVHHQDSFVQTELPAKSRKSAEIQPIRHSSQHEQKEDRQGTIVMNRTCDLNQSKIVQTRECSLRDNFVGRIIKNKLRKSQEGSEHSTCPRNNEYSQILQTRLITRDKPSEEGPTRGQQRLKRIVRRSNYCNEQKENQPLINVQDSTRESARHIPFKTAQKRH